MKKILMLLLILLSNELISQVIDSGYLNPTLGNSTQYKFTRLGDPNDFYAGLLYNFSDPTFGDGNDFSIFTYNNNDMTFRTGTGNFIVFPHSGGNLGIGLNNPSAKLSVYIPGATSTYPTSTTKGDVIQSLTSNNNGLEFGNGRSTNDRKAWILARHSQSVYQKYYSVLHLQPDIGDKSKYKGVSIGYHSSEDLPYGTHLAVNGSVGIGTTDPKEAKLVINHGVQPGLSGNKTGAIAIAGFNTELAMGASSLSNGAGWIQMRHKSASFPNSAYTLSLNPLGGRVGIGTFETGSHQLAVEGSIGAREIKVEVGTWSDFVFYDDYKLPTLEEVESYIKEKGHLQDIPNAEEAEKNGIYLGKMNAKLLQKIEELMLYTIEQEKRIQKLESLIKI